MSITTREPAFTLIGIDGGATEVKTHHVLIEGPPQDRRFRIGDAHAARKYERVPGFTPLPVAEQLRQRSDVRLSPEETEQARRYVQAACESVLEVTRRVGANRVLIGMGMPGLKTSDGRGIDVINNGPRIPDYLDQLERLLREAGVSLAAPVARLGSDADYCGIGEEYATDGSFRGVQNAYYLGGGTGIADAMKLRGLLVPFDHAKSWIHKAWQIPSCLGPTFEKLGSASGLNTLYAALLGATTTDLADQGRFPETEALNRDSRALTVLGTVTLILAELIYERIHALALGRAAWPHRGQAYLDLTPEHPYRGLTWDRIVLGQRLGRIYGDPRFATVFRNTLDACLARMIAGCGEPLLQRHYLTGDALRDGLLVASRLREAPAIGAAIDAVQSHLNLS